MTGQAKVQKSTKEVLEEEGVLHMLRKEGVSPEEIDLRRDAKFDEMFPPHK